jgi:hypothetical protein
MNVTDLRKAFTAQGIKGFSSANRAAFNAAIAAAEVEAYAEDAARTPKPAKAPKRNADGTLKGKCTEGCGRRITKDVIGPEMCTECLAYAEWENAHSDQNHEALMDSTDEAEETKDCPVCRPELDPRNVAPKSRSRAGMVIIAKGTEIHKSETFRVAAEASGWTVTTLEQAYETDGDEEPATRHYATATKGDESISLAWEGRAYDYHASSAVLKGKARKVRNLKEALRLI